MNCTRCEIARAKVLASWRIYQQKGMVDIMLELNQKYGNKYHVSFADKARIYRRTVLIAER